MWGSHDVGGISEYKQHHHLVLSNTLAVMLDYILITWLNTMAIINQLCKMTTAIIRGQRFVAL